MSQRLHRTVFAAGLAVASFVASAEVTRIEITKRQPFAGGTNYGNTGAYERLTGKFHGELDPAHASNAGITDIERAPRNARGRVEYSGDLDILKPVDLSRGNGTLLYDVNNRGNKTVLAVFNSSATRENDPTTEAHGGNGFLMRNGFTVVWSGWISGIAPAPNVLRLEVPSAPGLEQTTWDEILFNVRGQQSARLSFKPASTDKSRATLYVLDNHRSTPRALPAEAWEFTGDQNIRLLPAGKPFPIGVLHQLTYPVANPPVTGIGFAATRDLVAFLRNEGGEQNPLAAGGKPASRFTLASGQSQSGRYLRDFLHRGFNDDESGRRVFDGINPHIAAAMSYLNQRYAQTYRASTTGYGFRGFPDTGFPFAYGKQRDPFTGREDGLLAACQVRNNCPKIAHTISSVEYWQAGNSLVTTDPLGKRDMPLPENVRVYHFSGTQHIEFATMPRGVCALPPNLEVDPRPVMRSILLGLDRWVKDGTAPPPSAYPRIDRGTLTDMKSWRFPKVPGIALPIGPNPRERFDYGPDFAKGVLASGLPKTDKGVYGVKIPQVDGDGNELGGVRVPELAVSFGTSTGWGVRAADAGGMGELCYLDGFHVPFHAGRAERLAKRDPRPSIEERYRDRADYVAKVRAAAEALKAQGYFLDEDVERAALRAEARW